LLNPSFFHTEAPQPKALEFDPRHPDDREEGFEDAEAAVEELVKLFPNTGLQA